MNGSDGQRVDQGDELGTCAVALVREVMEAWVRVIMQGRRVALATCRGHGNGWMWVLREEDLRL